MFFKNFIYYIILCGNQHSARIFFNRFNWSVLNPENVFKKNCWYIFLKVQ